MFYSTSTLSWQVYDRADPEECEVHRTKVFVCLEKKQEEPGLYWTGVGIAHTLLFLTLLSFFSVRDLRCLQGQYMICFLISLLVYNICLLPGSVLILSISFVSCVSLGKLTDCGRLRDCERLSGMCSKLWELVEGV